MNKLVDEYSVCRGNSARLSPPAHVELKIKKETSYPGRIKEGPIIKEV